MSASAALLDQDHTVASNPSPPLAPPERAGDVAVKIRNLSKHFGRGEQRVTALKDVSWDVYKGQMSLITGPSGCGKTTLLSVVAGILNSDEGSVNLFGEEVTKILRRPPHELPVEEHRVHLPAIQPAARAHGRRERGDPLVINGWPRSKAVNRAREVLRELGMAKKTEAFPSQLSGGQQQRVAISRSLVHSPRLLVCDEPTAALDHETGLTVMDMLRKAAVRPDRAVIVVTHDNRVFHFGDRIARMDDGQLVEVVEKTAEERARLDAA